MNEEGFYKKKKKKKKGSGQKSSWRKRNKKFLEKKTNFLKRIRFANVKL